MLPNDDHSVTKYCVLSANGNENDINEDANNNNIISIIKDTKLYVSMVTLSAKGNQKSKVPSKGFGTSVYWNEYKMESGIKIQQMNLDIFSNQILLESIDCLVQFTQIMATMLKDLMLKNIISLKVWQKVTALSAIEKLLKARNCFRYKTYEENINLTTG